MQVRRPAWGTLRPGRRSLRWGGPPGEPGRPGIASSPTPARVVGATRAPGPAVASMSGSWYAVGGRLDRPRRRL